jgi:hypothetical protein
MHKVHRPAFQWWRGFSLNGRPPSYELSTAQSAWFRLKPVTSVIGLHIGPSGPKRKEYQNGIEQLPNFCRTHPRSMGRWIELERRHRAATGRGPQGHSSPIPDDLAGGRRRPAAPGAELPGWPDCPRWALVRWSDHDGTRHGRTERRRSGLHRRLRA